MIRQHKNNKRNTKKQKKTITQMIEDEEDEAEEEKKKRKEKRRSIARLLGKISKASVDAIDNVSLLQNLIHNLSSLFNSVIFNKC